MKKYFRIILIVIAVLFIIENLAILTQLLKNTNGVQTFNETEMPFGNLKSLKKNNLGTNRYELTFSSLINNDAVNSPLELKTYCDSLKSYGINNDSALNLVFVLMTDSLLKCYSDSFVYNANNCHNIIFWAEEFKCFEANDTDVFQPIYVGIFDFWMNKVALVLSDATRNNSDLKYNNNFFYLNQRLTDYKYAIGIKYSNTEKVIENIVNGKWSYLLKRYFLETSTFINLLLVFFLVLTIYTYYLFLISFFKKKNSNKYSGEL